MEGRLSGYTDSRVDPVESGQFPGVVAGEGDYVFVGDSASAFGGRWQKKITIDPMDRPFGAVGDGVADDTAAFTALAAACPAAGANVRLRPNKTFLLSNTFRLAGLSNLHIRGYGAKLKLKGGTLGGASVIPLVSLSGCDNVTCEGFEVDGNRAGQSGYSEFNHGVAIAYKSGDTACTNVTLRKLNVHDTAGDNITVGGTAKATGVVIDDCDVANPNVGGAGNPRQGIALIWAETVRIRDSRLKLTDGLSMVGRMAIDIEPNTQSVKDVIASGCTIDAGWNRSLSIAPPAGTTVQKVTFRNNTCSRYLYASAGSGTLEQLRIIDNDIDEGIHCVGVKWLRIIDNECHNKDRDALTVACIYLSACTRWKVTGNTVDPVITSGATIGIRVIGASHHGQILDNDLFSMGGANMTGIKVEGGPVGVLIDNNAGFANGGTPMPVGIDLSALSGSSHVIVGDNNNFRYNVTAPVSGVGNDNLSVASAAALTLPEGRFVTVTGTADITSITATQAGRVVTLKFSGTAATNGVVDGSNLKLNGNFLYTPDDTLTLGCDGTNWFEIGRSVN